MSRNSQLRNGTDPHRFEFRWEKNNFLFPKSAALESTQPSFQWIPGSLAILKQPGGKCIHSLPFGAKVTNEWCCTSTRLICRLGTDRDSLTFKSLCLDPPLKSQRPTLPHLHILNIISALPLELCVSVCWHTALKLLLSACADSSNFINCVLTFLFFYLYNNEPMHN